MSQGVLGALLEGADGLVSLLLVQPTVDCHDLPNILPVGMACLTWDSIML